MRSDPPVISTDETKNTSRHTVIATCKLRPPYVSLVPNTLLFSDIVYHLGVLELSQGSIVD